jgi:hypothetical protein
MFRIVSALRFQPVAISRTPGLALGGTALKLQSTNRLAPLRMV